MAVDERNIGKSMDVAADDNDSVGTEMYFRATNGEIVFGRIGMDESELIKRMREGWVPLREYGAFKVQPYHMEHPFEVLFQRGGAKEMSVRQVIDQGFYFRPPLVPQCHAAVGELGHLGNRRTTKHTQKCMDSAIPAEFPQLAGEKIEGPFLCKWCSDDADASERKFATAKGLRQHESVMHSDEIGSDRLGAQLIKGLGMGRTGDVDMQGEMLKMREEMEALRALIPTPTLQTPVAPVDGPTCPECGKVCGNAFGLQAHRRSHKKELTPVG